MFVSVQFNLEFENKQDRERVLSLMRTQSSTVRFIYDRLVALVLPLLDKPFVRDFSPLKSVIIEGKWRRLARRLVLLFTGGRPNKEILKTASRLVK